MALSMKGFAISFPSHTGSAHIINQTVSFAPKHIIGENAQVVLDGYKAKMKPAIRRLVMFVLICMFGTCVAYAEGPDTIAGKQKPQALELAKGAFVNPYVMDGYGCKANEVMVGVHIKKGKVICASLNFGYRVSNRVTDPQKGTQVSENPNMHGCPRNFFIQGMNEVNLLSSKNEELKCVSLETKDRISLEASPCIHDGRGKNDKGTQSDIYGLTPTMHACPKDYAMRGIHQRQNDLYCCR